jgi:uncharacterized delta-60 repeat protein
MKNILILTVLSIILQANNCLSQSQFQLAIGGTNFESAFSIIQTADGGYALTGVTIGQGYEDINVVKLTSNGSLQWTRTVGGAGEDGAPSIIQSTDGNYVVAGWTDSFGVGALDIFIVKLSSNGSLLWSETIGGADTDYVYSTIQTSDGGYALAGVTKSFGAGSYDMFIVKLASNGSLLWSKTVGGMFNDWAHSIIQNTEGGYTIAGHSQSFAAGYDNMYIIKLDANGSLDWSKTVGGASFDRAESIVQTTDGGYAIAGYTQSFGAGTENMYVIKLASNGSLQWSKSIGGTFFDWAASIIQTTDGGYEAAGYTHSFGTGGDMYIIKLDTGGSLLWSRAVGGPNSEAAYSILPSTDGSCVVAGHTDSFGAGNDVYIVKLDKSGNTCGNSTSPSSIIGTPGSIETSPTSIVTSPNPTLTTPSPIVVSYGLKVTTICVIGINPISAEIPNSFSLYQNYPNPFNPSTVIKFQIASYKSVSVKIYDMLGKEITTLINEKLQPGTYEVSWDGSNYASGVYFYQLIADDKIIDTKKMLLVK